ncbi:efflux RND transporter periplasmic adaptor subunit [Candidatus Omnitrophota bacterium]
MKISKVQLIISVAIVVLLIFLVFSYASKRDTEYGIRDKETGLNVTHYTCGMHPSVKVLPKDYKKDALCPICNMALIPVLAEKSKSVGMGNNIAKGSSHEKGSTHEMEAKGSVTTSEEAYYGCGVDEDGKCLCCDGSEKDALCTCGGHDFAIKGSGGECPVCEKPLRKLTKQEADKLNGVIGRVSIKRSQAQLAGVRTEQVRKRQLFKMIRTAGKVAYDPQLAIAQEEFISSLNTLDKIREGRISEIETRSTSLVESSRRKLRLLGLSDEQIMGLQETREVQTNLVLPEEKMWIYGDAYEYELGWIRIGERVKVTAAGFSGEEFLGVISSVSPVVNPMTRSVRFRAQVDNVGLRLKPQMYVDIVIMSKYEGPDGGSEVLAVPKDAVLDTGARKVIWIDIGDNIYEGREVLLGPEAVSVINGKDQKFYPALKGLTGGERVVVRANFLIDSQSQITGVASSAYGGALGDEDKGSPSGHLH